nr:hypothetical protein [uncultured Flavobacterium sp.]
MKTFLLKSRFFTFICLLSSLFFASVAFGQAYIKSDLVDYQPGSTAILTGAGFQPGESVRINVLH